MDRLVHPEPGTGARQNGERLPSRSLPAYLQIEEELAERIESGAIDAGSRLPTERGLAAQMLVSRMTVRQALARLEQRGLIVRRQGSGIFAAEPTLRQDASHLRGFFDGSVGHGVFPVTRLVERAEILATRLLAAVLGVPPGSALMLVERTAWDGEGRPVEHARDLYRGDRNRFITELTL